MTRSQRLCWRGVVAATALTLVAASCGDGNGDDDGGGGGGRRFPVAQEEVGHATLRFSGAIVGSFDSDAQVSCFPPREDDDRFTVSIDKDRDAPGGQDAGFRALDLTIPSYRGARTYDIGRQRGDEDFSADDFFLLFAQHEREPFGWSRRSTARITIDADQTSGSLSGTPFVDPAVANC